MFVQLQFSGKLNRKTLSRLRSIDYNFDEEYIHNFLSFDGILARILTAPGSEAHPV